jgi:hypothetical protein
MESRRAKAAFYSFCGLLWLGVATALAAGTPIRFRAPLIAAGFAAMTVLSELLRIRVRKIEVSSGALIGYLSITALGPKVAALIPFAGVLGLVTDPTRRVPWTRRVGFWLVSTLPTLMAVRLVAGYAYAALARALPADSLLWKPWVLPFLGMELVYSATNVVLLCAQWALREWRSPLVLALDVLRQHGPSLAIFLLTGVVLQSVYYQLGPLSLVIVLALLLLTRFVFRLYAEHEQASTEMAATLAHMLALRDPYTGGHSQRVADLSVAIGRALGLGDAQLDRIRASALVHDIGKVAVPDAVLRKPGPLEPDEWVSMDLHIDKGGEILEGSPHLRHLIPFVRAHHVEYAEAPQALPLEARIIAVADAFDAMTTDRPYRKALPVEEAVRRLRQAAGSQFDPVCVEGLVRGLGLERMLGSEPGVAPPPASGCGSEEAGEGSGPCSAEPPAG